MGAALGDLKHVGWGLDALVASVVGVLDKRGNKVRPFFGGAARDVRGGEDKPAVVQYLILLISITDGVSRALAPLGVAFA